MQQHRQLSAILFTDIEGYSAIMQENEDKAIIYKNRHREILQIAHSKYEGRIVQFYGDGTLSIFQSAVQAVQCAIAMQMEFRKMPKVPVRMALHVGDIVLNDNSVAGDGVNLASRVESLAVAGSILISDKVYDEIRNHPEFTAVSVGTYQFKNIERLVEVFALEHNGLVVPDFHTLKGKTEPKRAAGFPYTELPGKSIAVLPFTNMSNDPEQDFFSEGIAEEILNALSGLKDLKVASRSSSFPYSGKNIQVQEIGEKLGVSTVLQGSVRRQGNRLRVMVQLINTKDGFHIWSERYDRGTEDIFAIQDEVAMAVTDKLRVILAENDQVRMTKNQTSNPEAYEYYLKGRYYINKRGASIYTGLHFFELAINLDPEFALAHTGYADANLMAAFYGLLPSLDALRKAKTSAEKALSIDPERCEPYCTLGCLYSCFEWNWEEAEKYFLRSIELNHKYSQAHFWYGSLFLSWVKGDFFGAEMHGRMAIEHDPSSSICYGMYASILHTSGKFKEALAAAKKGIDLDPESFVCYMYLGWAYVGLRKYDEAIKVFETIMETSGRHHFSQNALIVSYCIKWQFKKARALFDELKEKSEKKFIACSVTAISSAFLDEMDTAFEYFEKAYQDRDPMLLSLKYERWVPDTLKEDPRYNELLKRIGFP